MDLEGTRTLNLTIDSPTLLPIELRPCNLILRSKCTRRPAVCQTFLYKTLGCSKKHRAALVRIECGLKVVKRVEQYVQEERGWREEGLSSNSSPFEVNWHKSQFRFTLAQRRLLQCVQTTEKSRSLCRPHA